VKKAVILVLILTLAFLGWYIKNAPDPDRPPAKPAPAARQDDSIEARRDAKLQENGYELKSTGESFKIDENAAIGSARKFSGSSGKAAAIRTAKGRLTNRKFPYIAGSDTVLNNYPVWIVTFHNVDLIKHGGPVSGPDAVDTIQADQNIFVDAESGEVLMSMAYSI
jgi:hypothetical protein